MKPKENQLTLQEILSEIQYHFKSKKGRTNSFASYKYRSADDLLQAIKPYLRDYGISITINEELISGDPMPIIQSTVTIHKGQEEIKATSVCGIDLNQKGLVTPQRYGSASSYAKKYALCNLLAVDDSDNDPDQINDHNKEAIAKQWMTQGQMVKATSFLKSGGSLASIKEKYSMTKAMEEELLKIQK